MTGGSPLDLDLDRHRPYPTQGVIDGHRPYPNGFPDAEKPDGHDDPLLSTVRERADDEAQ